MEIINQLQSHWQGIKQTLEAINQSSFLAGLPNTIIDHEDFWQVIPIGTSGLYFLDHPEEGLLYVGKAKNVRNRWSATFMSMHDCLETAAQLGNVRLCWWNLPSDMHAIIERMLIDLWRPKWNDIKKRDWEKNIVGDPEILRGIWRK